MSRVVRIDCRERDTAKTEPRISARLELAVPGQTTYALVLPVDLRAPDKEARGLNFATRFGHNLARCRDRAGISQEELGMRAELHRTAIGQLERGERVARTDTLVKLAGSLAVSPVELLDGLEWEPSVRTHGKLAIRDDGDD